jgi:hypothetical protein
MSRAAWATAALLALTACSDGYQGDGPPLRLHYDMTRQEALAAMSRIGLSVPNAGKAFALRENCLLTWRTGKQVQTTPLLGTEATLAKQPEGERFRVVLTSAAGSEDAASITVLADAPWAEATQMKWLLDYVRRFC